MRKPEKKPVIIRISPEAGLPKADHLRVYLLDKDGKIVEDAPFKGLECQLKINAGEMCAKSRVYIAGSLPKEHRRMAITEKELKRSGAYEATMLMTGGNVLEISHIPLDIPELLPFSFCHITGHLDKNFLIDGACKTLPVCHARVHVCEVDRIRLIKPFPYWLLKQIRDHFHVIFDEIEQAIDWPWPWPGPDPDPIGPVAKMQIMSQMTEPGQANVKQSLKTKLAALPDIPGELAMELTSASLPMVQKALVNNLELLHPYLCLNHELWHFLYHYDEIATVYTDANGKFSCWYNTWGSKDHPDIYIWVEVCIDGHWECVYKPCVPCHTDWDYACGTDIHVTLTDPRIMPCGGGDEYPGDIAWFRSLGYHATALHIEQDFTHMANLQLDPATGLMAKMKNIGCTDLHDSNWLCPFGGTLGFRMLFGSGLPNPAVTHYRWKKARVYDASLNYTGGTAGIIGGDVYKYYYVITNAGGVYHFETHAIKLGPIGSGENAGYIIPKWNIYDEPLIPAAHKALDIQWIGPDFFGAWLNTTSLDAGLYDFSLELLSRDGAGNFHVVAVDKTDFQVSEFNNAGDSQPAPAKYLKMQPGSSTKALSLRFYARIENEPCVADIQDAMLVSATGVPVVDEHGNYVKSGKCGFIRYTDVNQKIRIRFIASQARQFAWFSFNVVKGNNTEPTHVVASGYVGAGAGSFKKIGGIFTADVPVSQLLGTCPGQAAFAEGLDIDTLITDGTYRLEAGHDDNDSNSFALSTT